MQAVHLPQLTSGASTTFWPTRVVVTSAPIFAIWQAAAHPKIQVIQRTGLNADEDFVWADGGVRCVCVLQDVRPAVLMKNNCFHGTSGAAQSPKGSIHGKECPEGRVH